MHGPFISYANVCGKTAALIITVIVLLALSLSTDIRHQLNRWCHALLLGRKDIRLVHNNGNMLRETGLEDTYVPQRRPLRSPGALYKNVDMIIIDRAIKQIKHAMRKV